MNEAAAREFLATVEDIEDFPAFSGGDWHAAVHDLMMQVINDSTLLPPGVSFWLVADTDGILNGALITLDVNDKVRLCTLHMDWRDLTYARSPDGDAREYAGIDGALAVIDAATDHVNRLLTNYNDATWAVISDVRASYDLALQAVDDPSVVTEITEVVNDYLANHYGDE